MIVGTLRLICLSRLHSTFKSSKSGYSRFGLLQHGNGHLRVSLQPSADKGKSPS